MLILAGVYVLYARIVGLVLQRGMLLLELTGCCAACDTLLPLALPSHCSTK